MRTTLAALSLLLTAACASTYKLPGSYAVVVEPELASRWETDTVVNGLRRELQNVDVLDSAPALNGYDAVVRLGLENVRGAKIIDYEILSRGRGDSGRVALTQQSPLMAASAYRPVDPVGRTARDVLARAHSEDRKNIAKASFELGTALGTGAPLSWETPPAGQLENLARIIARDLRDQR